MAPISGFQWLKKLYRNPLSRGIRRGSFHFFNFFYAPFLYSFFSSNLNKNPRETQIFFMTRGDFGTVLVLLEYIRCWEERRGKTCLVILTCHLEAATQLAKIVCPNTKIISPGRVGLFALKAFKEHVVYFHTFMRVYARLVIDHPQALYIFLQGSSPRIVRWKKGKPQSLVDHYSSYVPFFDKALQQADPNIPKPFVQAYTQIRYILDYNQTVAFDMIDLYYQTDLSKPRIFEPDKLDLLKQKLAIRDPYVLINISCRDEPISYNRKKAFKPQEFNQTIDYLISLGYTVVIQGRKEQPLFKERKALVDYSKSAYCSAQNDLLLYSGCCFGIMSKSGPENFGPLCNIPILGVNYVELPAMQPSLKMRFFPKHIRNKKTGRYLSWKEWLRSPFYFDVGDRKFDESIEYVDLEAEELLAAVKEFLFLLPKASKEWTDYTPLQVSFKKELHPLHLDLFYIKGVPCNAYLSSSKAN